MPRTNIGRDPVKERHEAIRRIILHRMIDRGIRFKKDLYALSGIEGRKFERRMNDGKWEVDDIAKLAGTLKLTTDDAAVILGIGGKT